MKKYFSYFRLRLVHSLQYRTAAAAGIVTQFFWGFMEIQLYRAFYYEHAASFPMEFRALVSYIWLRQAFLAFFNTWTFENELFQSILNGNVAYELVRPASLYGMWFSRAAAVRISRAALRFWPILIVACLLPAPIRLSFTQPPIVFVYFILSMMLTLFVTVAFSLIVY
ncbi:MAG: ABC transporter permease, partial [Clostridia bacterium]|nr:ABC transporter permease [Clostridia bacterium]